MSDNLKFRLAVAAIVIATLATIAILTGGYYEGVPLFP